MTSYPTRFSPSGRNDVEGRVRRLAVDTIGTRGKTGFGQDGKLIDSQVGFDSIAFMEFVLRVEDSFGIHIPDEDLRHDVFESVQSVTEYVRKKTERPPDKPLPDC